MLRNRIPLLLTIFVSTAAYATTEIGKIIKSVMTEQKDGHLPWSFYAQPGYPSSTSEPVNSSDLHPNQLPLLVT
jgi:hypothetical protein